MQRDEKILGSLQLQTTGRQCKMPMGSRAWRSQKCRKDRWTIRRNFACQTVTSNRAASNHYAVSGKTRRMNSRELRADSCDGGYISLPVLSYRPATVSGATLQWRCVARLTGSPLLACLLACVRLLHSPSYGWCHRAVLQSSRFHGAHRGYQASTIFPSYVKAPSRAKQNSA